jgi:hypothetical protein
MVDRGFGLQNCETILTILRPSFFPRTKARQNLGALLMFGLWLPYRIRRITFLRIRGQGKRTRPEG